MSGNPIPPSDLERQLKERLASVRAQMVRDYVHKQRHGLHAVIARFRKPLMPFAAIVGVVMISAAVSAVVNDSGTVNVQVTSSASCASGTTSQLALVDYIGNNCTSLGAAGSGVFSSFVRVQADGTEAGYNTDGTLQFDTKSGSFTHSMLLSNIPVVTVGGVEVMRRVKTGEAVDVVVLSAEQIDQLIADGALVKGSRVDLVKSGVAVAVRKGAAKQDISSEAAVKKAVLASKSVGYSTGPSGVYLERLLAAWDPDQRVKRVQAPPGVPVGSLVAKGEVELGFQQLSELIHLPGIEVLGPLPPGIQLLTVFSAGVSKMSSQPQAVRAALAYMASPNALAAKHRNGLSAA